jgi:alkylation response protein AidB-like acyl-CoA dehydrogenase
MNFDPDPRSEVALAGAEALCTDVLPSLPKEAGGFFGGAYRAFETRRLFAEDSVEVAARAAMRLGAASGSLAIAFASGFGFNRARTLAGAAVDAPGRVLGVLELGAPVPAQVSAGTIRLHGESRVVAGGPIATHAVILADTGSTLPAVVSVDLAAPGVSRIPPAGALGFDFVPVCALRFEDVATQPVTLANSAASIQFLRNMKRILEGAVGVGIGRRSLLIVVEHLRSLGKRPSQGTEFSLSDVATELDAAELSVLRSAWAADHGSPRALESASAKLLASRAATHAAHTALMLTGNSDCTNDLRQCYLEACALEFQSETSAQEVATIASEMLEES